MKPMPWHDLLYSQGFGTRRICLGLIEQGRVEVLVHGAWQVLQDPGASIEPEAGMPFRVLGQPWVYHRLAYLVLHKPAGTECSHKPGRWPSIYSLLPAPLRLRPAPGAVQGVQAVGRLDQDTTGLLLLSDDGAFIHRMASPKHHVPKVYELTTADALDAKVVSRLLAGVVLHDDPRPVRAAACTLTGSHTMQLTLTEGKYHQVKRMLAAVGNRVVGLHRSHIGAMALPQDLQAGQWRWLSAQDLGSLMQRDECNG